MPGQNVVPSERIERAILVDQHALVTDEGRAGAFRTGSFELPSKQ